MSEFTDNLDILIRARQKIIVITTWEEDRCMEDIIKVIKKQMEEKKKGKDYEEKKFIMWDPSYGFTIFKETIDEETGAVTLEPTRPKDNPTDVGPALDWLIKAKENHVCLFMDLPKAWGDDNPLVQRYIKIFNTMLSHKHIITISGSPTIPSELSKVVTVVDYPLPTKQELTKELDYYIDSMPLKAESIKKRIKKSFEEDLNKKEEIVIAGLGLTMKEFAATIKKSIVRNQDILIKDVTEEKEQIIKKSGKLEFFPRTTTMESVGGLDMLKKYVSKLKGLYTDKAKEFGIERPRGLFLLGPVGTGKSLSAKAIASELNFALLRLDMSRIKSKYVGDSENNMWEAIKLAEAVDSCVLWIDEVDKAFAGAMTALDSGVSASVMGMLLTWMQEHKSQVLMLCTCNRMNLPIELVNRFEKMFFIDFPEQKEREDIFKIHLTKRNKNPNKFDIRRLASETAGFNGREIERSIKESLIDAFSQNKSLTTEHILDQIQQIIPASKQKASPGSVDFATEIELMRDWASKNATPATSEKIKKGVVTESIEVSDADKSYS